MLEQLRKQGASIFVWVIFAILIAVFAINFGPQSPGAQQGCRGAGANQPLTVGSSSVDETGYRLTVNLTGGEDKNMLAFEQLIRRELLAQEADRRGLRIPDGLVDHFITQGRIFVGGRQIEAKAFFNEDDIFDYKLFRNWTRGMRISVGAYKRQQAREIKAWMMASILSGSVPVSRDEALEQYVQASTMVTFDGVRFDPRRYGAALLYTDADLDRYLAEHEAEVKATYSEALYKGKKQLHVRRVWLPRTPGTGDTPAPAAPDQPAPGAPAAPVPADPAPPPPAKPDPAKAKLAAARADIVAGRKTFVAVASALDADQGVRARGGEWGWHDADLPTLEDPGLNPVVKTLEANKVSEVITTDEGHYLLLIDDKREGDLTFDQVKRELAAKLAREAWGREAARRAAIKALEDARAGAGKNLSDLFPTEKTGAVTSWSVDVPVKWDQADGPSGQPATPPATGTPTPAPPATDQPAGPHSIMVPSTEKLPPLGTIDPPTVETFGPFARRGDATPAGASADLAKALFEELTSGMLGTRIYEVRPGRIGDTLYMVVQVLDKKLADTKEFEKNAGMYMDNMTDGLGDAYLEEWLATRCIDLARAGKIRADPEKLREVDEEGRPKPITYVPCITMAGMSAMAPN